MVKLIIGVALVLFSVTSTANTYQGVISLPATVNAKAGGATFEVRTFPEIHCHAKHLCHPC